MDRNNDERYGVAVGVGFRDWLGKALGNAVKNTGEILELAREYQYEYEYMSNDELLREYKRYKDPVGRDQKARKYAIQGVIKKKKKENRR